jgi:hypothetical protein
VDVETMIAFPVRAPERPPIEIRVNFGVFAGREATRAEIEALAALLLDSFPEVQIVAEQRYEFGREAEGEVHQVAISVPGDETADEFDVGAAAGRIEAIAERWARECIADRHADVTEL